MSDDISPIRKQYLDIKRDYPDTILFFRLGDFYETFDQDAQVAARELDIVLTSRNVAKGTRVPMAGIPAHAAEGYIARLISRGLHVAICDQVGDAVGGLMPREVVRVFTPGTLMDETMLAPRANNYLVAALVVENHVGIAYADVSTGEFRATATAGENPAQVLRDELARLNAAEVLVPQGTALGNGPSVAVTELPPWKFELGRCEQTLLEHFSTASLEGFGLAGLPMATRAAGALVQYVRETQPKALGLLAGLAHYSLTDFMLLDAATRRGLELTETLRSREVHGSLLGVLDQTATPMGARLLRVWINQPLLNLAAIQARQNQVQAFVEAGLARVSFREPLGKLGDLERLANRTASGHATPRDLVALRAHLGGLPTVRAALEAAAGLAGFADEVDLCADVLSLLQASIAEDPPTTLAQTGVVRSGFSEELDQTVAGIHEARRWIANLEAEERARTGIRTLKVGFNKIFGYYLEVTRANANAVPPEYIRKQTLVNAERYITPQMKEVEAQILNAEERIREIEGRLFAEVCCSLATAAPRLQRTSAALARLDLVAAFAEIAVQRGYVRPMLVEEDVLEIVGGRHPVVEQFLSPQRFVPNDAVLEGGERIRVITGPNMSGKSTYLRQVALLCLMAQIGSFVPATSARIGLVDRIFTRIGAQDEIHSGQSTFMVEMIEAANILHHATRRSLLIFDEVGRGTSTYDGVSIAWAVIEYIHNHPRLQARTFFATHYHELIRLAEFLPAVRNYNVAVVEQGKKVVFLHQIVAGGADRSYGIHVAQLAGLPRPIIARAEEILAELESQSERADKPRPQMLQLSFVSGNDPLREALAHLDVPGLTPIEALNLLYEWQKRYTSPDGDLSA
ncbi:MAG: DNA mismatch repair protein MutS [Chloroflexi bacterium]|nr:DNA mismatch repair protein MutS [Chloroflexota bacterium]